MVYQALAHPPSGVVDLFLKYKNLTPGCLTAPRNGGKRPLEKGPLGGLGVEVWEGDERRKLECLESGDSPNGRNLFTELPFL